MGLHTNPHLPQLLLDSQQQQQLPSLLPSSRWQTQLRPAEPFSPQVKGESQPPKEEAWEKTASLLYSRGRVLLKESLCSQKFTALQPVGTSLFLC